MAVKVNIDNPRWSQIIFGAMLAVTFFLPWVDWNGSEITGAGIATGNFFSTAETRFGLANPFPQLSFSFYSFWLIPILGFICITLATYRKKTVPLSFVAGALSLGLLVIYYLFSTILVDLGVGNSAISMLKASFWLHAFASIGLILTAYPVKSIFPKIIWIFIGPVVAFAAFKMGEKQVMSAAFKETKDVKTDFTVQADSLIREFLVNDTAANKKYLEKVLVVNGNAASIELRPDSSSMIKFADSTGSYAIFSLEKDQYKAVKDLQTGSPVSVKGVCSGSIFSDILGTTSINFKRSTLNK
jgi:hypothetical protein